ncbi:MAG: hypothetical protein H0W67_00660 [Gemmatimonadales bacterium]|nr:hypothetical protein [Gemmatimonadales bacterium]
MRPWWLMLPLALGAACSNHDDGPGDAPDTPASLVSTTLDGAVALTWSDNPFSADPGLFQNYRVYSTTYDLDNDLCGTAWRLEGTTVAPEFVVGALSNGVSRCFSVTAESVNGGESGRSPLRADTPRPEARNVVIYALQAQAEQSGFRFWNDGNGDRLVQDSELGVVVDGGDAAADFFVDRDPSGALFITPRRAGTGVELYDEQNPFLTDLTSVDLAPDRTYRTSGVEASPGYGYVFEMDGGDGFKRYGALHVSHVGANFLIADWSFQTDPGNPELRTGSAPR